MIASISAVAVIWSNKSMHIYDYILCKNSAFISRLIWGEISKVVCTMNKNILDAKYIKLRWNPQQKLQFHVPQYTVQAQKNFKNVQWSLNPNPVPSSGDRPSHLQRHVHMNLALACLSWGLAHQNWNSGNSIHYSGNKIMKQDVKGVKFPKHVQTSSVIRECLYYRCQ